MGIGFMFSGEQVMTFAGCLEPAEWLQGIDLADQRRGEMAMEAQNERRRMDVGLWVRANRTVSAILLLLTLLVAALFFAMWQGRSSGYEAVSQNIQLAKQVSVLQTQVSDLNRRVESLQKELEAARKQAVDRLSDVAALQNERDTLQTKVGALEKQVSTARSESADLKRVVAKYGAIKYPKQKRPVHRNQIRRGCGAWKCYVVRPGDTPGGIAAKMYPRAKHPEQRWVALLEANGVPATLENARKLSIGKRLIVPAPKVASNLVGTWKKRQVARNGVEKLGAVDAGGKPATLASGVNSSSQLGAFGRAFLTDPEASKESAGMDITALWPNAQTSLRRTADGSQEIKFTGDILATLPVAARQWYGAGGQGSLRESSRIARDGEVRSGHDPP